MLAKHRKTSTIDNVVLTNNRMVSEMKKQISLVLLGLGLSSGAAFAAHMDETPMPVSNDINVTAPDQSGMWSFGGTVVLQQPTNKAFHYADVTTDTGTFPFNSSDVDHKEVDQAYKWWFGADVTYHFPGNGRDVTLAYEGLHGNEEDHTSVDPNGSAALTSTFQGFIPYLSAEGETDTNYDAGDLVFGQKLDVGERIRIHPFMGLRYAHIDMEDTGEYSNFQSTGVAYSTEDGKAESEFNGIGPRFGSDAQINLGQGFSIRGRLGLSALIGTQDVTYHDTRSLYDTTGALVATGTNSDDYDDNTTRVIPEIDGRLGLNYTYDFDSNMALGVEAGWQVTNYFNAVQDNDFDDDYRQNADFGLQGPYARLQLDIA